MPPKFPHLTITLAEQVESTGEYYVEFDMSDEFISWFKKDQGLKRWSKNRFEKWVAEHINEVVAQQKGTE